ncbi:MAG TPA: aryl-sulfate sulfotransferase [Polyangia bacterium]|nr:aryl-sulfate sulfotransferase [Polyangia bacterium]
MSDRPMRHLSAVLVCCGALLWGPLGCSSGSDSVATGGTSGAGSTGGTVSAGSVETPFGSGMGGCTFSGTFSVSPKISTVGIVTFTTMLEDPTEAHIDFGLDTSYGMTAPVDLTAASYRTLLLGMKPSKTYHFRLSATDGTNSCTSDDFTIVTGSAPNGMQNPTITTYDASALYGGFLVTGQYSQTFVDGTSAGAPAFILDKDGTYVWWYTVMGSDATGVTMSYDGNYMWINSVNTPSHVARVHRVSMDGLIDEDHSSEFVGQSHQLTVLPDETVAFYAYGTNGCDDIKLRAPDGTVTTLVNAQAAHGGSDACHVNAIFYSRLDDTLIFGDLDNNCLTKITRTGATVWVLNGGVSTGPTSSFTGDIWKGGEHGFHILGLDDFVIFNNNSKVPAGSDVSWGAVAGDGTGSWALEMKLDLTAMTATQIWSYQASGLDNTVLGDAQRLPNGNTMVDLSTKGTIEEVDANDNLLQEIQTATNFGYMQKRATLYGPPPR